MNTLCKHNLESRHCPLCPNWEPEVREQYPCGCEYVIHKDGTHTHYVHPDCKYDNRFLGNTMTKGYYYVPWR